MLYGYKRKTVNEHGLLEMKEVTFAANATDHRAIGSFLLAMAEEMDRGAFDRCSHMHIGTVVPGWSAGHPGVDIVVMPPTEVDAGEQEEERMAEMAVEVSYGQLAVFDARMERPFNDWAEAHVAQGFSWRPGSVSFGTLQSGGTALVRVCRNEAFDEAKSRAERILAVPFTVPSHGEVEIGSIAGGARIALPAGEYELVFEHGQTSEGGLWVSLWFREVDGAVEARVVRADSELDPPERLVMIATPA